MALKDILLICDSSQQCPDRLALAVNLAQKHQAHLTALFPLPARWGKSQDQHLVEAGRQLSELFRQKTQEQQVSASWVCEQCVGGDTVTGSIARHTQVADLVVLGQTDPERPDQHLPADLPERLVIGGGRPVLLVPYAGTFPTVGERVLVGWRGGRESTRAVNDALPLLKMAKMIRILTINPPEEGQALDHLFANELCLHLGRHGIAAQPELVLTATLSVGDTLLNRLTDEAADLLVMGVYAQNRRGSQTLGEVGRHLLRHMTVPVLMSH